MAGLRQLRIALTLQSPCLMLGEVQVQRIDLVLCQETYLLLQLFHWDKGAAEIVHKASHAEGGPVDDIARLQLALLLCRDEELL